MHQPRTKEIAMTDTQCYVGIDVSGDRLDAYAMPENREVRLENNDDGVAEIIRWLGSLPKCLVVIESTGGCEDLLSRELFRAGFDFAVINPKHARDFAKGLGILAKNDRIDARVLARFGQVAKPRLSEYPDQLKQQLDAAVGRREQLVEMLRQEKNRRHRAKGRALRSIDAHIAWLQAEIKDRDREIRELIKQSPAWLEKHDLLKSMPGVGDVTASVLIADLPELGRLNRGGIAKLAGLAPMDFESGRFKGERHIAGGRSRVRCALYMAAMSAVRCNDLIRAYYRKLRARGKAAKEALVACARKILVILNEMARHGARYEEGVIANTA
jgi:transposase